MSSTGGPTGLSSGSTTTGGLGSSGRGGPESDRLGSDKLASNHPTGHGGVGSSLTPGGERGTGSTVTGLNEGHETLPGGGGKHSATSGLGATATGLSSGTAGTSTTGGGATHGIPERAEHELRAGIDAKGNTGDSVLGREDRVGDHVSGTGATGTHTGSTARGQSSFEVIYLVEIG